MASAAIRSRPTAGTGSNTAPGVGGLSATAGAGSVELRAAFAHHQQLAKIKDVGARIDTYLYGDRFPDMAELLVKFSSYEQQNYYQHQTAVMAKAGARAAHSSGTTVAVMTDERGRNDTLLRETGFTAFPPSIMARYKDVQCKTFMGLLPEINAVWITFDSQLYLWNYTQPGNTGITIFDEQDQIISAVGLVRPRSGVFLDEIEFVLVITTPLEIIFLGLTFAKRGDYNSQVTVFQTDMTLPADNIVFSDVVSTPSGRIFLTAVNGSLYEIQYQAREGWFSRKASLVNMSTSIIGAIVPSFLRFGSPDSIVYACVDPERDLLWTVTKNGVISAIYLGSGADSSTFKQLAHWSMSDLSGTSWASLAYTENNNILQVFPVSRADSQIVHLVAVSANGDRFFFSLAQDVPQAALPQLNQFGYASGSRGLRLLHAHQMVKGVTVRSGVHHAICTGGLFLSAISASESRDTILAVATDSNAISRTRKWMETHSFSEVQGCVWDIKLTGKTRSQVRERYGYSDATDSGMHNELSTLDTQNSSIVSLLTSFGIHNFVKLTPLDVLITIIIESPDIYCKEYYHFVEAFGPTEACACCLAVACSPESIERTAIELIKLDKTSKESYGLSIRQEAFPNTASYGNLIRTKEQVISLALRLFLDFGGIPMIDNVSRIPQGDPYASGWSTAYGQGVGSQNYDPNWQRKGYLDNSRIETRQFPGVPQTPANTSQMLAGQPYAAQQQQQQQQQLQQQQLQQNSGQFPGRETLGTGYGFQQGGLLNSNNIVPQRAVKYSGRHEGLLLFISRTLRPIWKSMIFDAYKMKFTVTPNMSGIQQKLSRLTRCVEHVLPNGQISARSTGQGDPAAWDEEAESLRVIYRTIKYAADTISFLNFYSELDGPFKLTSRLQKDTVEALRKMTFEVLVSTSKGAAIIKEITSVYIDSQIESNVEVEQVGRNLRQVCPSLCHQIDILFYKGKEALSSARACGGDLLTRRTRLTESFTFFASVLGDITYPMLLEVVGTFVELDDYEDAIALILQWTTHCKLLNAQLEHESMQTKENVPYGLLGTPNATLESRQYGKDVVGSQRLTTTGEPLVGMGVHNQIPQQGLELLISLIAKIFDPKASGKSISERQALLKKLFTSMQDIDFHYEVYHWLVANNFADDLLAVEPDHLESYLLTCSDLENGNILGRYYVQTGKFGSAAQLYYNLAHFPGLNLEERIKYLMKGAIHVRAAQNAPATGTVDTLDSSIDPMDMEQIVDMLTVAQIQRDILKYAQASGKDTSELNSRLMDISELFNRFAAPWNLYDIQLNILEASDSGSHVREAAEKIRAMAAQAAAGTHH